MPYSNLHSLTVRALGFTVAFSVACRLTELAARVTTVGLDGGCSLNAPSPSARQRPRDRRNRGPRRRRWCPGSRLPRAVR